jgi:hypothetical protein
MDAFADAIRRAVEANPMCHGKRGAAVPGRVLLTDGDGLAYYCAGNDGTSPGQARVNLISKLDEAKAAGGAETSRVLMTARGSHKGHRYAIARVKPYQGQRTNSRRPKNWEYLRGLLEGSPADGHPTELTGMAEADDLFGKYSSILGADNVVIHTQDKDMRMVPGWHLEWSTMRMTFVPNGCWAHTHNGLLYGRKWFWMQMLHGDGADYIPGLPKYITPKGTAALCGPATAEKLLAECGNEETARHTVFGLYRGYYPDDWQVQVLEQSILLWMRNDEKSSALNVLAKDNPLDGWPYQEAVEVILRRIAEAQV